MNFIIYLFLIFSISVISGEKLKRVKLYDSHSDYDRHILINPDNQLRIKLYKSSMQEVQLITTLANQTRKLVGFDNIPLINLLNFQYYGYIQVGIMKKNFKVLFDTGSSWTWLPAEDCDGCNTKNRYYCRDEDQNCHIVSNEQREIFYGMGQARGNLFKDIFQISEQLKIQSLPFLSVYNISNLTTLKADGVCGLDFYNEDHTFPNILETLKLQGEIQRNVFSLYLSWDQDENGEPLSELIFGGYDEDHMAGEEWHYTPVIDDQWWAIGLQGFSIDDIEQFGLDSPQKTALIDSGSSLLHIPEDHFYKILRFLIARDINCAERIGFQKCECSEETEFPNLKFLISGKEFLVLPEDYIYRYKADCYLLLASTDDDEM